MPAKKSNHETTAHSGISPDDMPDAHKAPDMESIARRYLDLWQDNIRCWATDPETLRKWPTAAADQKSKN